MATLTTLYNFTPDDTGAAFSPYDVDGAVHVTTGIDANGDLFFMADDNTIEIVNVGTVANPLYGDIQIDPKGYLNFIYGKATVDYDVFRDMISTNGTAITQGAPYNRIFSFPDGTKLGDELLIDGGNNIFGTTETGGTYGQGTIFELSNALPWSTSAPQPALSPLNISVVDTTTLSQLLLPLPQTYTGPVAGLEEQYINTSADSLSITVLTADWFIHSGSGDDAIAVSSGTNVLDGGTGSNFLTGGSGTDTFFVDDRNAPADIWSTVNNFHAGDAATIWGIGPQDHTLDWVDNQGAAGYSGLTLHAMAPGMPTASLTLVGFTQSDLKDGRLSVSFGSSNGSSYMYVQDNS
jgi:Ca2+-binding RTX toxin-like protein